MQQGYPSNGNYWAKNQAKREGTTSEQYRLESEEEGEADGEEIVERVPNDPKRSKGEKNQQEDCQKIPCLAEQKNTETIEGKEDEECTVELEWACTFSSVESIGKQKFHKTEGNKESYISI